MTYLKSLAKHFQSNILEKVLISYVSRIVFFLWDKKINLFAVAQINWSHSIWHIKYCLLNSQVASF